VFLYCFYTCLRLRLLFKTIHGHILFRAGKNTASPGTKHLLRGTMYKVHWGERRTSHPSGVSGRRARHDRNVLLQFSLFMLAVIALASVTLGFVLAGFVRGHVIRMHAAFYAESLSPNFTGVFVPGSTTDFRALKADLEHAGRLPHIKGFAVWDASGNVLFGDAFFDAFLTVDDPLRIALDGSVHFVYDSDPGYSIFKPFRGDLFLFLPVKDSMANVSGVIGLRESDDGLSAELGAAAQAIVRYVILAGIAIYGCLFLLYYRSYRRQKTATDRLEQSQASIIFAMSSLSSLRDLETGGHLERCSEYVRLLATRLRAESTFRSYIDDEYIRALAGIAPLHDIGKVGIDDAILRKPGKLTNEEFDAMKEHSAMGADILRAARERLPFHSQLELAVELTRHHHERWDGRGYPDGLKGEAIPLSARIMAIADVYDALRSERYYKKAMPHAEAVGVIEQGAGSQFDPRIVPVFSLHHKDFESIFEYGRCAK